MDFTQKVNCFLGNNGMGKTNILDAIFYLSFCQSSLSRNDHNTVRYGEDYMLLQGVYERAEKVEQIACAIQKGKRKSITGKDLQNISDKVYELSLTLV